MTMVQEFQKKKKEKSRVLESARKLFDARDDIIDLFEKGTFPYKGNVFKTKKKKNQKKNQKNQNKTNFLYVLRMNQKVLTMTCLKHILVIQHLLFWQENYLIQKIKRKIMTQ